MGMTAVATGQLLARSLAPLLDPRDLDAVRIEVT